jgi:uncharacterized protein YbjT (DUF2867 family)
MRVLLTGANGFIGRYLLAHLLDEGHQVVPAVRNVEEARALAPAATPIPVDFNRDIRVDDWLPRLDHIDAVINCAGILQGSRGQSIEAIHSKAPQALFSACRQAGVRRVIQLSAISAEPGAGTAYATTKREADDFLKTCDIDWVIVRPSLVYAGGAYGGTALFRALASLPFAIPVPGSGNQLFQPIHISDLADCIARILADPSVKQMVIDPVGPQTLTLRDVLVSLRSWLGFGRVPVIEIPEPLISLAAKAGDILGGPLNSTALRQLEFGNTGDVEKFIAATGIRPKRFADVLLTHPSQWQDRWHARLYFLRPVLRFAIALMWIASGAAGLLLPESTGIAIGNAIGIADPMGAILMNAACLADIAIGIAVLARWQCNRVMFIQVALVLMYTLVLSATLPYLWGDPFGSLLKNIPVIAAILVLGALEQDR